jgi:hypothetical protein
MSTTGLFRLPEPELEAAGLALEREKGGPDRLEHLLTHLLLTLLIDIQEIRHPTMQTA